MAASMDESRAGMKVGLTVASMAERKVDMMVVSKGDVMVDMTVE